MTKMNLPTIDVDAPEVTEAERLQDRIGNLERELAEAQKLIQAQASRINSDLAMKMAIAKLLA